MAFEPYLAHTWQIGEAITKAKMDHLENGVAGISTNVSALDTRLDRIDGGSALPSNSGTLVE